MHASDAEQKRSPIRGFDDEHDKRKRRRREEEASNMRPLALTVGALPLCKSVRYGTKMNLLIFRWSHICDLNWTPVKTIKPLQATRLEPLKYIILFVAVLPTKKNN